MGLFGKSERLTAITAGTIVGVSAVKVNGAYLPLAEYEVGGVKYRIRVPHGIAKQMESECDNAARFACANASFGTSVRGQMTRLIGCSVKIMYDPEKPKNAKVIGE